jgi:chemotaxis protein MotB
MNRYKINNDHDDAAEGYLVSVSDMMSGLLFVFIITLMVFVINFHIEKTRTEDETRNLKEIKEQLTDAKEVRKQLLVDLKESLEKQGVKVQIDVEKGLLHIPEAILFRSGRAEFQSGGEESLTKLAQNLADRLPCYAGKRGSNNTTFCNKLKFKPGRLEAVLVEGHTDNVPIKNSSFDNNWDLSAKRSIVTFQHIITANPLLGDLINADGEKLFGVSGYADTRPVVNHLMAKDEPLNRRIDLRFILAPPEAKHVDDALSKN